MNTSDDTDPSRLLDEAARWIGRRNLHTPSPADEREFAEWLSLDGRHEIAYEEARRVWQELTQLRQREESAALVGESTFRELVVIAIRRAVLAVGGILRTPASAVAFAGSLILLVAVILLVYGGFSFPFSEFHQTKIAEVHETRLSDGSTVTIGANTKIRVQFTDSERRVALLEGQAFFSVTKDLLRPFVVQAFDTIVRVHGTKFDVHTGSQEVRVSVLEGVVEVAHARDFQPSTDMEQPVVPRILTAGQQVLCLRHAQIEEVEPIKTGKAGEWRTGRLAYADAPLREVISDANRYYPGHIRIESPELEVLRITTSFGVGQIDQMLDTLAIALPLKVVRSSNGNIVLRPN